MGALYYRGCPPSHGGIDEPEASPGKVAHNPPPCVTVRTSPPVTARGCDIAVIDFVTSLENLLAVDSHRDELVLRKEETSGRRSPDPGASLGCPSRRAHPKCSYSGVAGASHESLSDVPERDCGVPEGTTGGG